MGAKAVLQVLCIFACLTADSNPRIKTDQIAEVGNAGSEWMAGSPGLTVKAACAQRDPG